MYEINIKNIQTHSLKSLPPEEKTLELFRRQRDLLATFLANGAISQAQHDKSLSCLIEKMRISESDL